jgi:hypothetical protein
LAHYEQWLFENDKIALNPALGAMLEPAEQNIMNHHDLDHIQMDERSRLVAGPGTLLLKLLAVQHNLGEELDLNGGVLSRLKAGLLIPSPSPRKTMKAMFASTKPFKVVSKSSDYARLENAFKLRHSVYGTAKDVTFFEKVDVVSRRQTL